jgi:SAM-dependent methyltransferase
MLPNTEHFCVLCESKVPGFEHGGKANDRKFCPKCRAKGRYRLIWLYLLRELGLGTRQMRVLHVAPERSLGDRIKHLDALEYVTADLVVPGVDVHVDLTRAGLSSGAFDLVLCNHVLEHIEADGLAISEFHRILNNDGTLFLTVATNKEPRTSEHGPMPAADASRDSSDWHYREYGLDLADRLRDAGFSVAVVQYMQRFTREEVNRLGLKKEVFFVCRKG